MQKVREKVKNPKTRNHTKSSKNGNDEKMQESKAVRRNQRNRRQTINSGKKIKNNSNQVTKSSRNNQNRFFKM
uniref:Uncharacterized protein n=1 Tax=Rhizophora mucronata TaxID=61149 RepID=A0A2P2IL67_RHIMU